MSSWEALNIRVCGEKKDGGQGGPSLFQEHSELVPLSEPLPGLCSLPAMPSPYVFTAAALLTQLILAGEKPASQNRQEEPEGKLRQGCQERRLHGTTGEMETPS